MTSDELDRRATSRRSLPTRWTAVLAALAAAACAGAVVADTVLSEGASPTSAVPTSTTGPEDAAGPEGAGNDPPPTRDDALRGQLAADPTVRTQMLGRAESRGTLLCGIRVLGGNAEHTQLFAWLACGDFTTGPGAELLSATSEPAVLTVTGHGAGIRVDSVALPRQQHLEADLTQMFPPAVADQVRRGDLTASPALDELLQRAQQASQAGPQAGGDDAATPGPTGRPAAAATSAATLRLALAMTSAPATTQQARTANVTR